MDNAEYTDEAYRASAHTASRQARHGTQNIQDALRALGLDADGLPIEKKPRKHARASSAAHAPSNLAMLAVLNACMVNPCRSIACALAPDCPPSTSINFRSLGLCGAGSPPLAAPLPSCGWARGVAALLFQPVRE